MIILNRSETMPKIIDKTFCRLDSACISNLINIYIVKKLRFVYLIYRGEIAALLQIGGWVVQIGFLILVLCLGSLQIIYGCSYEELDSPDFNPPIYLSDLEEDCIDSATTIGSISDDQSDGSQQTEDDIIKNIIDLATKFGKRDAPKNAQKGAGLTSERVLIALATLLMEKATCAAVFFVPKEYGLSESNQDMLWIGHNQGLKCVPSLIKRISTKIFSASLPRLHRNELLSDKEVRAILSLTSNQGREKAKYTRTLTQEADAMIHWFKKVARLREYVDCKTELGRIAKCLKENQIKYLCKSGIHAEMNILNELYDNDMLFDTGGYFGISKGCCLICGAVLEVLCTESEPYQANGCHFGVYNKWPVPSFLKDEKVLRKFTGKSVKDDKERGKFFDTINKFSKKSFERSSVQYSSKRQTGIAATTTESPCELNLAESEDATIALTKGKTKAHIRIVKKGEKKERINTSTKKGKKGIPDKMVNNKNKKGEKIVRSRRHS